MNNGEANIVQTTKNCLTAALQVLGWGCVQLDAKACGAWSVHVETTDIQCLICPVVERQYVFIAALVGEISTFRSDWMALCLAAHWMGMATGTGSFGTTADQSGLVIGRIVTIAELESSNLQRYLPELVSVAILWREQLTCPPQDEPGQK